MLLLHLFIALMVAVQCSFMSQVATRSIVTKLFMQTRIATPENKIDEKFIFSIKKEKKNYIVSFVGSLQQLN